MGNPKIHEILNENVYDLVVSLLFNSSEFTLASHIQILFFINA